MYLYWLEWTVHDGQKPYGLMDAKFPASIAPYLRVVLAFGTATGFQQVYLVTQGLRLSKTSFLDPRKCLSMAHHPSLAAGWRRENVFWEWGTWGRRLASVPGAVSGLTLAASRKGVSRIPGSGTRPVDRGGIYRCSASRIAGSVGMPATCRWLRKKAGNQNVLISRLIRTLLLSEPDGAG